VTICCAFATPADAALVDEDEELAPGEVLAAVEPLLELLELQAASTAVAVSTAPGASKRFHLFVISYASVSHESRHMRDSPNHGLPGDAAVVRRSLCQGAKA
jgi:hypothetical protein